LSEIYSRMPPKKTAWERGFVLNCNVFISN
jgi:hypothetical protein